MKVCQRVRVLNLQLGSFSADLHVPHPHSRLDAPKLAYLGRIVLGMGDTDNSLDTRYRSSGSDTIAITQDIAVALPFFNVGRKIRKVWPHAICISEQNVRE